MTDRLRNATAFREYAVGTAAVLAAIGGTAAFILSRFSDSYDGPGKAAFYWYLFGAFAGLVLFIAATSLGAALVSSAGKLVRGKKWRIWNLFPWLAIIFAMILMIGTLQIFNATVENLIEPGVVIRKTLDGQIQQFRPAP